MNQLCVVVLVLCIGYAVCDDEYPMDKIFKINKIGPNGQLTFGINMPELFEGDIVRNPRLEVHLKELNSTVNNKGSKYDAIARGMWPGGIIPYVFNRYFRGQSNVRQAIADYSRYTCIKWVPRTNQRNYVEFFHGGGCFSMIGVQGGRQRISLGRGCLQKGIVIHEMMHAAGFFHEQSRTDRDRYIRIVWGNINSRMQYNFQKYRPGQASTLGEPYDKRSVMHYGNYAFSTNGRKTIISLANSNERLGQRSGFSKIDIKQLNKYYQCRGSTTRPVRPRPPPQPTPPRPGGCVDKYPFCRDLANKWCSHSFVKGNCRRSCQADQNKFCGTWKQLGYCNHASYGTYMKKNCKKACGGC